MYEDPGGQAGLRYWEGTQWSPLLQPGSGRLPWPVRESAASWAALPVAAEPWAYPTVHVARLKRRVRACAILTDAVLLAALATGVWRSWWYAVPIFGVAVYIPGLLMWWFYMHQRRYRKLEKLAITASTGPVN